jgi:hypothetical protein
MFGEKQIEYGEFLLIFVFSISHVKTHTGIYINRIILFSSSCGHKTSVTVREEHGLRMFQSRLMYM